jgi:hypothetical protein
MVFNGTPMKTTEPKHIIHEVKLPIYWASALINDDWSGLDDRDEQDLKDWLESNSLGWCSGVSEDYEFSQFRGMGCDVATYTFIEHIN